MVGMKGKQEGPKGKDIRERLSPLSRLQRPPGHSRPRVWDTDLESPSFYFFRGLISSEANICLPFFVDLSTLQNECRNLHFAQINGRLLLASLTVNLDHDRGQGWKVTRKQAE